MLLRDISSNSRGPVQVLSTLAILATGFVPPEVREHLHMRPYLDSQSHNTRVRTSVGSPRNQVLAHNAPPTTAVSL